ncbi:MAG: N-glycosylase/DNA lyase [Candidatus Omnitrophota bacterium]
MINKLKKEYTFKKKDIKKRLKEFRDVWEEDDDRVFAELSFCVCTPQSKAVVCDKAISGLIENRILFNGKLEQIRAGLKGVRFPNNKAKYILENRERFTENGRIRIKDKINTKNLHFTRDWLIKNVKGIGLKEASHFLRNIGFGKDLAIVDVHIIKNMVRYGLLKDVPKNISREKYIIFENIIRDFSGEIDIPMGDLDLLLWSGETGFIFK